MNALHAIKVVCSHLNLLAHFLLPAREKSNSIKLIYKKVCKMAGMKKVVKYW